MLKIILQAMWENASILVIEAHLWACARAFPEPSDVEIIAKWEEVGQIVEDGMPVSWAQWAMWGKAGIQLDEFKVIPPFRRNFGGK